MPQAEKMPGIVRVSVSRPNRSAGAHPRPYLIHEFYFRDRESLRKALASEAGQAAGSALMEFASEYAQIILSEHVEEYRPAR